MKHTKIAHALNVVAVLVMVLSSIAYAQPAPEERAGMNANQQVDAAVDPRSAPSSTTKIEVNVQGTFIPAEKAVVPTANPQIRITRKTDVPPDFSVLLTRPDGRAGIGGAGKKLTVGAAGSGTNLEETGVGTNVFVGSIPVLIGVNNIHLQPAGGGPDFLSATMLNYAMAAEDMNGNGVFDTGEDANHNGRLDPGEDVNGDAKLQTVEDFNSNGVLDRGEDLNGNEFLDLNEDVIPNGVFSTNEDSSGNGRLDPGEDFDSDTQIGSFSFGAGNRYPDGPGDFGTIPVTNLRYALRAILLDFMELATDADISRFLRTNDLSPIGVTIDNATRGRQKTVTVAIPAGGDSLKRVKELNGLDPRGFYFFPDRSRMPVKSPLKAAALITVTPDPMAAGEALPARLRNGGAATPPGGMNVGYEAGGATNGGFDNDGIGGNFDELGIFWHHFVLQSFAAHRLIDLIAAGGAMRPLIAQVDSGIGGVGAGGAYIPAADIPAARILNPTDCSVNPCMVVAVNMIPDTNIGGHGNQVAHLLVGQGAFVLGTGKDVNLRPIYAPSVAPPTNQGRGVAFAATDPNVRVILIEKQEPDLDLDDDGQITDHLVGGVNELLNAVTTLNNDEVAWRPGINSVLVANPTKIVVIAAGNWNHDTSFTLLGGAMATTQGALARYFDAPVRGTRAAGNDNSLIMGISNSLVSSAPAGAEARSFYSNFGTRISVAGTGDEVPSLDPMQNYGGFGGTSGASPTVTGLLGELLYLDANSAAVGPLGNLQIVELVEATADDLGSTTAFSTNNPVAIPNDDAGNGPDNHWGHGRINAWKAVISALNGGIALQHGRSYMGSTDSVFRSLPLIPDSNTQWYGFEIVTSERQAAVWIDGTQLMDAGATIPNAPNITAYKGVTSNTRMERGVHDDNDGSAMDPAGGGRPGMVVEADPLVGIVPVGTRLNGRGQYVMTFSIQRSDLYAGSVPRTLSIRRRGQGVGDKPLFNLRLDTTKMKSGEVSGVTFDDFVFQIVPPDYGDAKISPTLMYAENGARHHNTAMEWLGKLNASNLKSVSPEHNADPEVFGGDPRVDVDGVDNRLDFHDRDGRDDGIVFYPLTYKTGLNNGKVEFTLGVFDKGNPRYAADADHSLFVNLWIDWDADGMWEEANFEHVLDGLQINPRDVGGGFWQIVNPGASGATTTQTLSGASPDADSATFESAIPVGAIGNGLIWARIRLDYGENVGRNDPEPLFESLPSMRSIPGGLPGLVAGAARFGEVEDYLIGSDFGDATDPPYPTIKGSMGARHLDVHQEWLGPDNNIRPNPTRETDATDNIADEDGVINLVNRDVACDGVVLPPLIPGAKVPIDVTITSSISARGAVLFVAGAEATMGPPSNVSFPEDQADTLPRYSVGDPKRRLYLSGWADWNNNGVWETPGEKIIDDEIDPQFFGPEGVYTLGEAFNDANNNGVYDVGEFFNDYFGVNTATFTYLVDVPPVLPGAVWFRFRRAYGENEATVDLMVKENDEDGRTFAEEKGGALFGEVEDYLVKGNYGLCGPGQHWVDDCAAGIDTINYSEVRFGIDFDLDCVPETTLTLFGSVIVDRSYPLDDSINFPGSAPVDGHLDVIDTEIVSMNMTGAGVTLVAGAGQGQGAVLGSSRGAIVEMPGVPTSANSSFQVFFEVDVGGGMFYYNQTFHEMDAVIEKVPPKGEVYLTPLCIPLFDAPNGGVHVANLTPACLGVGMPCEPRCGDNVIDPGEDCDGPDDAACPGQCRANCTCSPCAAADVNCDSVVSINDSGPFVDVLLGVASPCSPCAANMNGDAKLDAADIQPFIDEILGS